MPNLEAIVLSQLQSRVILKVNIISLNFCWTVPSLGVEYPLPMSPWPPLESASAHGSTEGEHSLKSEAFVWLPLLLLRTVSHPSANCTWHLLVFLIHLVTSGESGLSTLTCHAITHSMPIKHPPPHTSVRHYTAIDDDILEYSMTHQWNKFKSAPNKNWNKSCTVACCTEQRAHIFLEEEKKKNPWKFYRSSLIHA